MLLYGNISKTPETLVFGKERIGPNMEKIFNILDFGAVGDGKTDCTAAIQAAIDAADSYAKIIIPPGVYMVGRLHLRGQFKSLEGTSAWSFRNDGASVLKLNTTDTDCLLDITGAFGCSIKGVCLNGDHLGENIHGVKLYWDKYNGGSEEDTPAIDDCRIGCFSGDGVHLEHIWCFSIRHSMLHRNGGAGLFIDGWDGFIIDNWFTGNTLGGIKGGNVVASITCTGNRVEWNRTAGFDIPFGDSYNITGNFFDRTFGPALRLGSDEGRVDLVSVTGNIFRRSGAHVPETPHANPDFSCHMILTHCSDTVVTGNTMRVGKNDGGGGVMSPNYAFIIKDCKDCIVKDNTMARGSLVKNLDLRGDNSTCSIENNIGDLADENTSTGSPLLN